MNKMADIVPAREDPPAVTTQAPAEHTETWIRDKLETWDKTGRTALDMGRGIMFATMLINAAAALIFLGVGLTQPNAAVAATLSKGVELCLIGLAAAAIANFAAFLMQRSAIQSATLNLIETWRNLGNDEYERRKSADKNATMLFWVTANFTVVSVLLFLQGSWVAKDALI